MTATETAAPGGTTMADSLRARVAAGGGFACLWLSLGSVAIAEMAAATAPDAVVFDLQHGLWERQALEAAVGIVRTSCVPLARVAANTPHAISSALDAGVSGVLVPLVETAQEAAAAVAAARFPPEGKRSGGGVRPLQDLPAYIARARQETLLAVMIETEEGVKNAAAIAATPGLDMVFIGPGDLSLSLGCYPDHTPAHEQAVQAVLAACRAAGLPCGIFTPHASFAIERHRQGFRGVVLGDDGVLMNGVLKAAAGRFAPLRASHSGFALSGCTALVTGTNRGIGQEIVRLLLDKGARRVYCAARNPAAIERLIAVAPDRLVPLALDVTRPEAVAAAAAKASDVDLLVNNAGVNFNSGLIADPDPGHARTEIETNYLGTLAMARAFAPVLKRNGGGVIVNMLSILATANLPMMGSLCASKSAGLSLSQGLRAELKAQGTRIVAVLPGAVDTDMSRDFAGPKMPPGEVAAAVLHGIEAGLEEVYPGDMAAGVAMGLSLDPKAVERQFASFLPQAAAAE